LTNFKKKRKKDRQQSLGGLKGDNEYLRVEFLNIHTLSIAHQIKSLDIHKLSIGLGFRYLYEYSLYNYYL
jgi:hypothetical protein